MAKDTRLAIAIPCFNEQELIKPTTERLLEILSDLEKKEKISDSSYIYLVDDGSKDDTWLEIAKAVARHPNKIKAVKFSSNFGNQKALLAGMLGANKIGCSAVVTIDADLQDDCAIIPDMVRKYLDGFDVVYGVRNRRDTDTFFKKNTAVLFYKLMEFMGVKIVFNHADFRLLSRKALTMLDEYKERNV